MLRSETEMDTLFSKIQERMARGKTLRLASLGNDEQAYFREQYEKLGNRVSHPAARSELFVAPDDLISVEGQIDTIRDWVFSTGSDYTHHEDFPRFQTDLADHNHRTRYEWENLFFHSKEGPFSVHADRNPLLSEEPGDRLYLCLDDPKRNVEFRFDFAGNFLLAVLFKVGEGYYNTSRLPLGDMTQEEYFVMNHYMDQYIEISK